MVAGASRPRTERSAAHLVAYQAASKAPRRQSKRFRVEPDVAGFSVIEVRTAEPADVPGGLTIRPLAVPAAA